MNSSKRAHTTSTFGVPATVRRRTILFPLCLALSVSGCFRMINVDPDVVGRNEDLRVHLTPVAADRVAREFGTTGSRLVGRLAPAGQDSLALDTWLGQIYTDASLATSRLVIPLHRGEVIEVQRRELSVKRTVLASVVGAGMIALILSRTSLFVAETPDDDDDTPPPEPNALSKPARRWTISIPLRIGR